MVVRPDSGLGLSARTKLHLGVHNHPRLELSRGPRGIEDGCPSTVSHLETSMYTTPKDEGHWRRGGGICVLKTKSRLYLEPQPGRCFAVAEG